MRLRLRGKLLATAVLTATLAGGAVAAFATRVLVAEFVQIEQEDVRRDLVRVDGALNQSLTAIATFCGDWSGWSETRDFILGTPNTYAVDNLQVSTFVTAKIDFMIFLDASNRVVYSKTVNRADEKEAANSPSLDILAERPFLLRHGAATDCKRGIVMLPEGPALVGSGPVTNNDFELPINGTFIAGRMLDDSEIQELSERTQVYLTAYRYHDDALPADVRDAIGLLTNGEADVIREISAEKIAGYSLVRDGDGQAALIFRIEQPRTLFQKGLQTTNYFLASLLFVAVTTFLILAIVINRAVLSPMAVLNKHIAHTRRMKDLNKTITINSKDEFGDLADAFNEMTENLRRAQSELEEANRALVDRAREAGMADVATGVLHNVGNVLNSLNISASTIHERLSECRIPNLVRASDLIEANRENLAEFFTQDERGSKLPGYLKELGKSMTQDHEWLVGQLADLERHIQHIAEIISTQQSFAKRIGVIERENIAEIVEDAIRMNANSLERHKIHVQREFKRIPVVLVDRHVVLQILVNLISNAKHALLASDNKPKRIRIQIGMSGAGGVQISVIDNGIGIPPEHMDRIYAFGFTSRSDGHGFGLHASALAAKQLGGSLSAHSDGPGKGATFLLEFPAQDTEKENGWESQQLQSAAY
ncbi:MAG: HAMP domain-containing protein [Candidatus Hydrogenedentes bacterium]|nr:HAMP domain-containing protein [Candidatus Hydrogenedentota bacterium]